MLKRSPRVLGLWAGAIALAVATGAIVAGDLATLHRRAHQFGVERPVVVARRDLTLGATITPGDLATRRVYSSQVPNDVLDDPSLALGRTVRVPVVREAYVADANLAPRRRAGLDGVLPEGTRAMRVVVENGLEPPRGSAVDVYASFATDELGTGATTRDPATLIASGVPVLGTDGGGTATPDASRTVGVTLLVDEDDAAAIAFAVTHGRIVLALVPPEDARVPGLTRR
jgi:Flp pilus assembly protein CpaB